MKTTTTYMNKGKTNSTFDIRNDSGDVVGIAMIDEPGKDGKNFIGKVYWVLPKHAVLTTPTSEQDYYSGRAMDTVHGPARLSTKNIDLTGDYEESLDLLKRIAPSCLL